MAVFVLALALHILGTWALPLVDRDEPRFAEAAREMRQRGDYLVPHFNGGYRFDKPPLIYWLQVPCYAAFGENDFAARLPSAVAGALVAAMLFGLGVRMFDAPTGLRAAAMFTLSLQPMMMAKAATADMVMVACVFAATSAGWAAVSAVREGSAVPAAVLATFYGALALGFLAKGPVAWLPAGIVALSGPVIGVRGFGRAMHWPTGWALVIGAVALWALPAMERTEWEYFNVGIGKHVVARSLSAFEGHGSKNALQYVALLPFYFATVFASFFPWSLKLPAMFAWVRRAGWGDARVRYLAIGVILTFLVFTPLKTKLPHYTMPCFPMLALLAAHALGAMGKERLVRRWGARVTVLAVVLFMVGFPLAARYFPARELARMASPDLTRDMEFASDEYEEPSLVWYFRAHVNGFHSKPSPKKLPKYMAEKGPRFCVLPTGRVNEVFPEVPEGWVRHRAAGVNVAKGEWVDLTMLVKKAE